MKYVISESRLDNIIYKYLSSKFDNLKETDKGVPGNNGHQIWYVDKSGEPLVIIYPRYGNDLVAIKRTIYDTTGKMFGLETTDDIQAPIIKYFSYKWGLQVTAIFTFEDLE